MIPTLAVHSKESDILGRMNASFQGSESEDEDSLVPPTAPSPAVTGGQLKSFDVVPLLPLPLSLLCFLSLFRVSVCMCVYDAVCLRLITRMTAASHRLFSACRRRRVLCHASVRR